MPGVGPRFDQPTARDGYVWWYVDGLSDDGRHGITIIAFIGSVFSPYYALARRRGRGEPENHCAINVALYGEKARWAMTERRRSGLRRDGTSLSIGPSSLEWDGDALTIRIDEITAPLPSRLRGVVRVHPGAVTGRSFVLDGEGMHRWWPIAPCARVEVAMEKPGLRWSGRGYLDSNAGDGPLERSFTTWNWSRAMLPDAAAILYEAHRRDGGETSLALRCATSGAIEDFAPPPRVPLPRTFWRVGRETRADGPVSVRQRLEDAPFYSRSVLGTHLFGRPATAVHESLDMRRFHTVWCQLMLPFRMPRALG